MAKSKSELQSDISNLEQILNSGATTISVDGETTVFDLDAVRQRLRDLQSELRALEGRPARRPLFNRINLR